MNKLKLILFSIIYFLLSNSFAQEVVWEKTYDWQNGESSISINYNKYKNNYSFTGKLNNSSLFGQLNQLGDTINMNYYNQNDSLLFSLLQFSHIDNGIGLIAKSLLYNTLSSNEEQNISRLDLNGNIIWRTSYNIGYDDWYKNFTVLPDGSSLISGYRGNPQNDIYLIKIDRDGVIKYENQINQFGFQFNYDTKLHSNGSIWTCGRERPLSNFKYSPFILKLNSDGDLISKDTLPDLIPSDTNGVPCKISFTQDDFIIFQWLYKVGSINETCLIKTDTNYNIIWQSSPEEYRINTQHLLLDNNFIFTLLGDKVLIFDNSDGSLVWSYAFSNVIDEPIWLNDYAFDDSNNVVLCGKVDKTIFGEDDMYFTKISGVGKPIKFNCNNPPQIQIATASVVGSNKSVNLGSEAIENLKYSDVIAYNWYFEDGNNQYGQYINYDFDEDLYPTSFWCMLVVTDAVGCTDTMTIDAYTGAVVFPNPTWPPVIDTTIGIKEEINISRNDFKVYPNPFSNTFVISTSGRKTTFLKSEKVLLYDILGKQIQIASPKVRNNELVIDGSHLQKGIYILEIEGVGRTKIVKE